jgi:hypothetical protein
MKIDDIDFNVSYWSSFSKDDFVKQCLDDGLFSQYSINHQRTLLEKVYDMIQNESNASSTTKKHKGV